MHRRYEWSRVLAVKGFSNDRGRRNAVTAAGLTGVFGMLFLAGCF